MNTTQVLHQDHPNSVSQIRKHRGFDKAAVIATAPTAARCMVTTMNCGADGEYHLAHVLSCRPKQADVCLSSHQELELRCTSMQRLNDAVIAFLCGEDYDALIAVAEHGDAPAVGRWSR